MSFAWPSSHAPQPFSPDSIHVWAWLLDSPLDFGDVALAAHTALLDEEESDRFHRFHFDRDRGRFAVSHANMRRILGAYLGQSPESIRFVGNRYGKPELTGEQAAGGALSKPLRFNLSHSQTVGLLALAPGIEVGVDVEDIRPIDPEVARSTFSAAELSDLSRLDGDAWLRGFYHCWTRKEAIVKAEGVGLSLPLAAFDVSLAPGAPAQLLGTRPPLALRYPWKLHDLSLDPGLFPTQSSVAALAAADPRASVACFRLAERTDSDGH